MKKTMHIFSIIKTFLYRNYPYFIIILLVLIFFGEFFTKGYLLEGTGDRIQSLVPLETFALRSFQAGRIPQWIPHVSCGVTYIGTGYHNFFYPIQWIIYSLPEKSLLTSLTVSAIFHMIAAGFFFMLFAGTIIKNRFWALLSAISYAFSSTLTYNISYGNDCVTALTYLPLWLYLIASFEKRNILQNFTLSTIALSLIIVSGNMQLIIYIIGLGSVYAVYRSIGSYKPFTVNKKILFITIASLVMAFLICSIRISPFLASMNESAQSVSSSFEELAKFDRTYPRALLRMFVPLFFSGYNGFFAAGLGYPTSFNIYAGVLAAYLLLYAFIFIWNRYTFFWKIVITVIVLIVLGTTLAKLQYLLLGKAYLSFSRYAWLLPVPLAILFGIAGHRISTSRVELKKFIFFLIGTFLVVTGFLFFFRADIINTFVKVSFVNPDVYAANRHQLTSLLHNMRYNFIHFAAITLCIPPIFLALIKWNTRKWLKLLLIFLLAYDIIVMTRANIAIQWKFLSPAPFSEPTKSEQYLMHIFRKEKENFRIFGETRNTKLDGLVRLGLYKATSWGAPLSKHLSFLYGLENMNRIKTMDNLPKNKRLWELTCIAYRIPASGKIEICKKYMPRVKLFTDYLIPGSDRESRKILLDPGFDIYKTVILDSSPDFSPEGSVGHGNAEILEDMHETIRIRTEADTDSILLLSDSYAKGWTAYVDGSETPILRANIAFKAIAVPEGKHEVVFRYSQPGLRVGAILTFISLVLFIIISMTGIIRRKMTKSSD